MRQDSDEEEDMENMESKEVDYMSESSSGKITCLKFFRMNLKELQINLFPSITTCLILMIFIFPQWFDYMSESSSSKNRCPKFFLLKSDMFGTHDFHLSSVIFSQLVGVGVKS